MGFLRQKGTKARCRGVMGAVALFQAIGDALAKELKSNKKLTPSLSASYYHYMLATLNNVIDKILLHTKINHFHYPPTPIPPTMIFIVLIFF